MPLMKIWRLCAAVFVAALLFSTGRYSSTPLEAKPNDNGLAPTWDAAIQYWAPQIVAVARAHGIDPDLVAAVMKSESNGRDYVVSRAGAVGLMGVMPQGPGLEWRPTQEELANPGVNLRWGVSILSEIIRQSGGDIYAALAAYSSGWDQANRTVPREYAARVLDDYGRAVAARNGISPDIASHWTVAVEIRRGHVPVEPLIFGQQPISGLRMYGEHIVYNYIDQQGRALYIKGYAVPLAIIQPLDDEANMSGHGPTLEPELQARLGLVELKQGGSNPRIIRACLPSLSRLRGHVSTRWYAPVTCPRWHR
jgi:hypothetical protein